METTENIAVYGGAFNPPTLGHQAVIEATLNSNKVEQIIFSPDGEREDKDYKISTYHRVAMLEIFFDILKSKGFNVDFEKHFLQQKGIPTTTVDVDKYFIEKLGFSPYHIFGTDVIESMPEWKGNYNGYIETQLKKIFLQRKGTLLHENIHTLDNFVILPNALPEISSTMIREGVNNVKKSIEEILNPEIFRYIITNNLYKC